MKTIQSSELFTDLNVEETSSINGGWYPYYPNCYYPVYPLPAATSAPISSTTSPSGGGSSVSQTVNITIDD